MKTESYPRKDYLTKLLPLILMFLYIGAGLNNPVRAQLVVTLGTSTANTSAAYVNPFARSNYNGYDCQWVISASEIAAQGYCIGGGTTPISQIAFNVASITNTGTGALGFTMTNWNISMGNTTLAPGATGGANTITTNMVANRTTPKTTGYTNVYSRAAQVTPTTAGWVTYTFDTPFMWDGTSNIILEICRDGTNTTSASNYTIINSYYTNYSTSIYLCAYKQSTASPSAYCNETTAQGTIYYRPNMRLTINPTNTAYPGAFTLTPNNYTSFTYNINLGTSTNVVVILRETDGNFSFPSGAPPAVGQPFAGGTIIYNGSSFPQTYSGFNSTGCARTFYVKAYGYSPTPSPTYSCAGPMKNFTTTPAAGAPGSFTAAISGLNIILNGALDAYENPVVYVMKSTAFVAGDVPTVGAIPVIGSTLNGTGGTVVFYGTDLPDTVTGLTENTTYYFKAFSFNPVSGTFNCSGALTTSAKTNCMPFPPTSFSASVAGNTINLAGAINVATDSVIVIWNNTGTFTTPSGPPASIGQSFAGGTLLYKGKTFPIAHSGLVSGSYYYRTYSFTKTGLTYKYSCSFLNASVTLCAPTLPYTDGFESITAVNQMPSCVSTNQTMGNGFYTKLAPYYYNQAPHSGTKYGAFYNYDYTYDGVPSGYEWLFYGPFTLTSGANYLSSIYYLTDGIAAWRSFYMAYGPAASYAGMTTFSQVNNPVNTTYQQLSGMFSPAASGQYYIGVALNNNGSGVSFTIDDFSIAALTNPPSCVGTPTPADLATNVSLSTVMSWVPDLSATSYDVYLGLTNPPPFVANVTTSSITTPLLLSKQYYWKVVPKNPAGAATGCPVWSFTTTATFGGLAAYCVSAALQTADEEIKRVTLNTINNISGCGVGDSKYTDYTAISTNLTNGASYPITVVQYYCGTYAYGDGWSVYIDYNQDGDFLDANEKVAGSTTTANGVIGTDQVYTGNFTVPADAMGGPTRMRVVVAESNGSPASCGTYGYGETEDYTVILSGLGSNEMSMSQIIYPLTMACGAPNAQVAVRYKNGGSASQSTYSLAYSLDGVNWVIENPGVAIAPYGTLDYIFTQLLTMPAIGPVTLYAKVILAGDAFPANDQISRSYTFTTNCIDLSVTGILAPVSPITCGTISTPVTIKYKNIGTATQSNYALAYRFISGVTTSTWVQEAVTTPIASGQELTYTFSTQLTIPDPAANFTVQYKTVLATDLFTANDQLTSGTIVAVPASGNWCTDIGVASIVSPSNPQPCGGPTIPVTITYRNYGTQPQSSYTLQYSTDNWVTFVSEPQTTLINPGEVKTYTFATPLPIGIIGSFTIYARTVLTGDLATSNDAKTLAVTITPCKDMSVTGYTSATNLNCGASSTPVTIKYKNRGSQAQTVYSLAYRVTAPTGGTPGAWVTEPVINFIGAGQELTYTFVTPMPITVTFGTITVDYKVILTGDQVPANDQASQVVSVSRIVIVTDADNLPGPYYQTFDDPTNPSGYWVAGGTNNTWVLGTPSKMFGSGVNSGAASTPNSWVTSLTGQYSNGSASYVQSPCFDLSNMLNPQISMSIKYQIENKYDGVLLTYQLGNSPDNIVIGDLNEPNSNTVSSWYNDTLKLWSGVPCWAGTSSSVYNNTGYVTAKHPLTGLAGQSPVRFKVYLVTNNTIRKEGFAFDNVSIFESSELSALAMDVTIEGTVGDTINLKVKGGIPPYYYQWESTNPAGPYPYYLSCNGAPGCNPSQIQRPIATPPVTTTYQVKVWDSNIGANGFPDTVYASVTVFVNSALTLSVQYTTTVCDTALTQLRAIAGGGVPPYTYNWSPAAGLNLTNIPNPISDTNKTTTYYVTVTDNIGFSQTGQVTLTMVHGFPVVDVFPNPATVCTGDSLLLTATGGSLYSWSSYPAGQYIGSPNSPSTWVKPTINGVNFTAIVSSTCGVASSFTIVTIIPKVIPVFGPTSLPASVCITHAPILLAGSATPLGGVYTGPGVSSGSFNPGAIGAGTYTITYTFTNVNGCVGTATRSITVTPLPAVSLVLPVSNFCIGSGVPTTLAGAGNPLGGVYSGPYVHNGIFYADSAALGQYFITYTYTNENGCVNSARDTMFINSLPIVTATSPAATCMSAAPYILHTGTPPGGVFNGIGITGSAGVYTFNPAVSGSGTFNYTYCYTNPKGCSSCASSTITVYPLPTATGYLVDTATCIGQAANYTVYFTGQSPWTVYWKIGNDVQTPIVTSSSSFVFSLNPSLTTIYTIDSLKDGNSCKANPFGASFTITVNALPLAFHVVLNDSIGPYGHYCSTTGGLFVGLDTVQIGITYYLYRNNVYTGQSFVGIVPAVNGFWFLQPQTLDGVYTVKGVDLTLPTACESWMMNSQTITTDYLNVDVYAQFPEMCNGLTSWVKGLITNPWISNGGAFTFTWTPAASIATLKYDSILAFPTTSKWIKLFVTDAIGCSGADSVFMQINPLPVVQILGGAPTATVCAGQSVTLTTTVTTEPGVTVTSYAWSPSAGLNLSNPAAPIATPLSNTTYYVTVTNSKGCTQTAFITVLVNPSPAIIFPNGDTTHSICSVGSWQIPLQSPGAGSYTYLWSPAASLNNATIMSPTATPSATTTYSVTVTSTLAPYCFSVGTYTVVVDLPMTIVATGPFALCNNTQANLNVNVIANGTAPFTYLWSASPAALSWLTPQNTQAPTVIPQPQVVTVPPSPPLNTVFTVTVTDNHGCSATSTVVVATSNIAVAYAGPDVVICQGSSTTLLGSGGPNYQWFVFGSSIQIGSSASLVVSPAVTTTYELRTNSNCGTATSNVIVTVYPQSVLSIAMSKTVFCEGDAPVHIYGSASPAGGLGSFSGNGIVNTSNDTALFTPSVPGVYNLTFTFVNVNGCSYTKTQQVTVHAKPVFVVVPVAPVCHSAATFALNNVTPAGGTYSGLGVSAGNFTPSAVTPGNITITYTYTNAFTCTSSVTFVITVNPNPTVYNVTADNNGHICDYSPLVGAHIYLSGSDPFMSGVMYRLYLNGTYSGIQYPGTGLPIDFGPQTANGNYVVIATYPTGCSATMSGSVNVVIDQLPAIYNVSGGGQYCQGGSGDTIHLDGGNIGVTYELYRNGGYVMSMTLAANGAFNFTGVYGDGQYTVKAVNPSGCWIMMAGFAVIDEVPLPTAYSIGADPGGAVITTCDGAQIVIRMYAHKEAGVDYVLLYNGGPSGVNPFYGATVTWTSNSFQAGVYTVQATRNPLGCTRLMLGSVTINYYQPYSWSVNPADQTIDEGQNASFTASFTGSPAFTIVWQVSTDSGLVWSDVSNGVVYGGANTNTLYLTGVPYSMNHYQYRLHVTGPCGFDGISDPATLYVSPVLSVTFGLPELQSNVDVCALGEVLIPVYITNADSIASISLTVNFDNSLLHMLGQGPNSGGCSGAIVNCNPALSVGSSFSYSAVGSNKFTYAWYTFSQSEVFANNHGTVKLFDLRFDASAAAGGCYPITFDVIDPAANVFADLNGLLLTTNFVSGQICVSPMPVITSAGALNTEICENSDIQLFVNAEHPDGVTYLWSGPNGFSSTLQNPVISNASPAASGTYHVVVTSNRVGCAAEANVQVVVHPKPIVVNVILPNGNNACVGSGVEVALDGSEIGTTYELFITTYLGKYPVSAPDGIAIGTGGPITFGPMSVTGDYSVVATTLYGCTMQMTGNVHVQINPLPLWFNVIGGGHYCIGSNGKEIKLSGSQIGVHYTLLLNACCCQADSILMTVIGTGSPISFGYHMTPGYYSVIAVNPNTNCQNNMVGCVPIIVEPLPTAVLGGTANICNGSCGNLTLTMTGKSPFNVTITDGTTSFVVHALVSPWTFAVCPTVSSTYTIIGITDANGCTNTGSGSGTINVWDLPVVTVGNSSPVCAGGTINLFSLVSGFGTFNYVWTGPNSFASTLANPSIPNATVANAGTYNLTVTDGHGCLTTATTTVTVNPLPVIVASGSATCVGGRLDLHLQVYGEGLYTYSWTGPNGFTSTVHSPFISPASVSDGGIYTVVVTDSITGCSNSDTAVLTVYELPVVTCGSNSPVCIGETINLTASATGFETVSYSWTGPNGFTSTLQNPSIYPATMADSGNYVVTVWDGHQCVNTCTTHVVVTPLPQVCELFITSPNVYCFGCIPPVIWLACSEIGVQYTLYRDGIATTIVVNGDGDSISFGHIAVPGLYTVRASNIASGCITGPYGEVIVIEQAPPTAVIHGDTICVGEVPSMRIDLTGDSYWHVVITDGTNVDTIYTTTTPYYYTPGTGAHILAPTGTTTYTISLVVDSVCYNVGNSATLIVNPLPNKYTLVGGGYFCNGIGVNVGLNGSQLGIQYVLMSNGLIVASVVGTGSAISFGPQTTGSFTAYAVNPVTACTNTMNGEIVVQPDPGLYGFEVSGGGHYCFGQPGVSIFLSGSQPGIVYELLKGNIYTGLSQVGTGYALVFSNVTGPGIYTVLAFDPISTCTRNMNGSAVVVVDALPTATITGGATICLGQSTTLHVVLTGTAPWTIVINDGLNTQVHQLYSSTYDTIVSPLVTTYYSISTVIDHYCQNTGSGLVTVVVNSPTQFVVTGGGTYCYGGAGVIIGLDGSQIGVNYELFYNGVATGTVLAGTGFPLSFGALMLPGQYTVVATSTVNGCVRNQSGAAVIVISQLPWAYNVTGGGECCVGCSHVFVCIDGSQYGVVYELYINGAASGILKYGNGTEICWPYATVGGIYTVKGTDMQTGCWSWMTGSATVILWPTVQANIVGGGTICAGGCSTLTVTFTTGAAPFSFGLSANGGVPVVYSNIMANPYTITVCPTSSTSYTLAWVSDFHGCYNNLTTGVAIVNVTQIPGVSQPHHPAVCVSAPAFELTGGYPAGGVFSGVGISNGWFYPDIAGAGSHVITYTYTNNNDCQGSSDSVIIVNPLPTVYITGLEVTYCKDAADATIVGNHTPYGTFTGVGVYDNLNGTATFSPVTAGPGVHSVTYSFTDVNGCENSITEYTTVLPYQSDSIAGLNETYCLNHPPVMLTGIPAGGVFTGPGMVGDEFSPELAGVGVHYITYTYSSSNFCTSTFTATITVLPLPEICSFNGGGFCCVGCSVPAILTCSIEGVSYQLFRNGQQNVGLPVMGTGGPLLWDIYIGGSYVIIATNPLTGCSVEMNNTVIVEIIPQPVALVSGTTNLCEGQCTDVHVALSGYPPFTILFTNGTDTISVNGIMGYTWDTVVCPTTSTTYTVPSVQDLYCGNNGEGFAAITVHPAPPVFTVTGGGSTCLYGNGVSIGLNSSVNGLNYELFLNGYTTSIVFTGNGGPINFGTFASAGTYTVKSSSSTTCDFMMDGSAVVTILPLPDVTLAPFANVCHNAAPVTLSGGSPAGGYYTISGVPSSIFDASIMLPGNTTIGYVYTDGNGCTNTANQTIVVYPLPNVALAPYSDVSFAAPAFTLTGGSPVGGIYYIAGLPVTSFDPAAYGVGTYTVMYEFTDGNGCHNSASRTFTVHAIQNVQLAPFAPACLGAAPIVLTGGSPVGGTYSGLYVTAGVFTPSAVGTFAITYTFTNAYGGTGSATQNMVVTSCAVYTISGTVNYDNTSNTIMNNVKVYLKQGSVTLDSTTTNASGYYEFVNLMAGNYTVSAHTTKPWGGVNSNDALLIMKHFANITLLTGLRLAAADVNGSASVNSIDALLVAKRFVNQITSFSVGDWVFQVNTVTVSNANVVNDFKALCFGDVNGSYLPPSVKVPATISLNTAGVKEVKSFERFDVPVSIVGNLKVGAISLVLTYPENLYDVEGVQLRNFASSDLLFTAINGELRISWYNTKEMSLSDKDVLVTLQLRAKNLSSASTSQLALVLNGASELGDRNALVIQNVNLIYPKLAIAANEYSISTYPNPFNTVTDITYSIPEAGKVTLKVYNILGDVVAVLVNNVAQSANTYTVQFDASNLVAGVYAYKIEVKGESKDFVKSGKMVMTK